MIFSVLDVDRGVDFFDADIYDFYDLIMILYLGVPF